MGKAEPFRVGWTAEHGPHMESTPVTDSGPQHRVCGVTKASPALGARGREEGQRSPGQLARVWPVTETSAQREQARREEQLHLGTEWTGWGRPQRGCGCHQDRVYRQTGVPGSPSDRRAGVSHIVRRHWKRPCTETCSVCAKGAQ